MAHRKRWNRAKRAAQGKDGRRRKKGPPSPLIVPGDAPKILEIVRRYGATRLSLKNAKVDANEIQRLKDGAAKTLAPQLRAKLLAAIPRPDDRQLADLELAQHLVTADEKLCLVRAKLWRRERVAEIAPDTKDIPMFYRGKLTWVSQSDPRRIAQREREYAALLSRVDAVMDASSVKTGGTDLAMHLRMIDQRVLQPLLEWETSGFTQKHWRELTATELFVYMAPRNQYEAYSVLVSDESDLERVRGAIAQGGPRAAVFDPDSIPERIRRRHFTAWFNAAWDEDAAGAD